MEEKRDEFLFRYLHHGSDNGSGRSSGNAAFSGNALTSVVIPNSVTYIDINAFLNNPLTSITIGANVTLGTDIIKIDSGSASFENVYKTGGWLEGTYIRPDTDCNVWFHNINHKR